MDGMQSQTQIKRNADHEWLLKRMRAQDKRYGTNSGQWKSIKKMLMDLISRYRRKQYEPWRQYVDDAPGNWFGLQEISGEILDDDTGTCRTIYRMDDDLRRVLEVPDGTTCYIITLSGDLIAFHYANPHHFVPKLTQIKRLLKKVMPMLLIRNV